MIKNISFHTRDLGTICYGAGQGMGLYTSWASLAITNHYLVKLAAFLVGKPNFSDYLVLGDDVVIAGNDVAEKYSSLLVMIGVGVRPIKSVQPSHLQAAEFASKFIVMGKNLSPLPVGLILQSDILRKFRFLDSLLARLSELDNETLDLQSFMALLFPSNTLK